MKTAKTAKRKSPTPKQAPLDDLKQRLLDLEPQIALNPNTDPLSLDLLQILLVDMAAAVTEYGTEPDESFRKVEPKTAWKEYLKLWLKEHGNVERISAEQAPNTFDGRDMPRLREAAGKRTRVAWRVFLCQQALTDLVRDEEIRQHLEIFAKRTELASA